MGFGGREVTENEIDLMCICLIYCDFSEVHIVVKMFLEWIVIWHNVQQSTVSIILIKPDSNIVCRETQQCLCFRRLDCLLCVDLLLT